MNAYTFQGYIVTDELLEPVRDAIVQIAIRKFDDSCLLLRGGPTDAAGSFNISCEIEDHGFPIVDARVIEVQVQPTCFLVTAGKQEARKGNTLCMSDTIIQIT